MPFTLAGFDLQAAQLRMPRYGLWAVDVRLADGRTVTPGAAAELVLGDLVLEGTIGPGGLFVGESSYLVTGPAAWMQAVKAKGARDDNGVFLAKVVSDLAGELNLPVDAASLAAADRVVGYAWERDAGPAAGALEAVAGIAWWLDKAGALHLGPRPPAPLPASVRVTIEDFRGDLGWARVSVENDAISALVPGAVLIDPALPAPVTVAELVVHMAAGAVRAEVWTTAANEELRAIGAHLLRPTRWLGLYRYRVTADVGGRPSLVPFGDVQGLPTIEQAPKGYGLPGASCTLPGAPSGPIVLVGFAGGSPASPYVAGYLADQPLPLTVQLDAQTEIRLGGSGAQRLSQAPLTDSAFTTIITAFNALCAATGHAGLALLGVPSTSCAKTLGE